MLMIVNFHLWGATKGGFWTISDIFTQHKNDGFKGVIEGGMSTICALGDYGVHIFIIASGFGLAASWWRKYGESDAQPSTSSILSFWKRRLSRIFPLYWMAHGLALVIGIVSLEFIPRRDILTEGIFKSLVALGASLTTIRNFSVDYNYFLNPAWWYVGLAVQLYLAFPVLMRLGKRWGWSRLLIASLLLNVLFRIVIIALPLEAKFTSIYLRGALFPTRLFEFAFGIVLAISLLQQDVSATKQSVFDFFHGTKAFVLDRRFLFLNLLLYIVGVAFESASDEGLLLYKIPADILLGLGEFCVVFQVLSYVPQLKRFFDPVGKSSYGIYLTHMNTLRLFWVWFIPILPSYWLRFGAVSFACCLFGGLFEYVYNAGIKTLLSKQRALQVISS